MDKEATKIFEIVLNNSSDLNKEIRMQFYKLLDLDGKKLSIYENEDIKIKEEIKSSIEKFSFNSQELDFLIQLREIIEQEMKKIQFTGNYDLIQNSLLQKLKGLKNIDISLEEDFKELSSKIANPFISKDKFYNYFIAKKEKITEMIKSYNQNIINALINLTPKLIEELKSKKIKDDTQRQATPVTLENLIADIDSKISELSGEEKKDTTSQEIKQAPIIPSNLENVTVNQEQLINACKVKYNELQRRLSYLENGNYGSRSRVMAERGQLKYAISQLDNFIKGLSMGKSAQDLMNKYSNETDINKMIESIISEAVPAIRQVSRLTSEVDQIYGKIAKTDYNQYKLPKLDFKMLHNRILTANSCKDLLAGKKAIEQKLGTFDYDTNQKLKEEYDFLIDKIITLSMENERKKNPNPEPTPSIKNAVGNSKSDVEYLVKSNNFYGVLQGIQSYNIEKYREFIMLGFNTILNRLQQEAALCNSFVEKEKSYQDLVTLYENFRDYIPVDVGKMLKDNLEEMEKYIEQQRAKNIEIDGVRYKNSNEQINQNRSSIKF